MPLHPGNAKKYDMSTVAPMENSPLAGKTVLFLGSSVTFGSASLQQGIPEYFARRFGCHIIKEAVSGTTLADNGTDSYVRRLVDRVPVDSPVDLLVCQLSTNDASRGIPLGDLPADSSDTATVTGAMEFIIRYARETWGCPVAFYTGSRFDSAAYGAMVTRVLELEEKRGILVLNLWDSEKFNAISPGNRALYMRDPIHPTKAGYKCWWCPELERQLLTLLPRHPIL